MYCNFQDTGNSNTVQSVTKLKMKTLINRISNSIGHAGFLSICEKHGENLESVVVLVCLILILRFKAEFESIAVIFKN